MQEKGIAIFAIIVTLISCNYKVEANFELTNNTGFKLDSLRIEAMMPSDVKYISINPNQQVVYKVDMSKIEKVDGSYRLSYQQDGETITENFGYYSNGQPLEKLTRIVIEKDSLIID